MTGQGGADRGPGAAGGFEGPEGQMRNRESYTDLRLAGRLGGGLRGPGWASASPQREPGELSSLGSSAVRKSLPGACGERMEKGRTRCPGNREERD